MAHRSSLICSASSFVRLSFSKASMMLSMIQWYCRLLLLATSTIRLGFHLFFLMGTCQVAPFRLSTCGFEQLHPWEASLFQSLALFQGSFFKELLDTALAFFKELLDAAGFPFFKVLSCLQPCSFSRLLQAFS